MHLVSFLPCTLLVCWYSSSSCGIPHILCMYALASSRISPHFSVLQTFKRHLLSIRPSAYLPAYLHACMHVNVSRCSWTLYPPWLLRRISRGFQLQQRRRLARGSVHPALVISSLAALHLRHHLFCHLTPTLDLPLGRYVLLTFTWEITLVGVLHCDPCILGHIIIP